jgi:hypothetical protein
MTKRTPRTPPTVRSAVARSQLGERMEMLSHAPTRMKAGTVKMAPAAKASPTAPVVRAMFSSRMLPLKSLRTAMEMTAAGNVAATVMPALRPR